MFSEYLFGRMFSVIEISMPYMLFVGAVSAWLVFKKCREAAADELRVRRLNRQLSAVAECCAMVALFSIATIFGRSLVTHDKDVLIAERDAYSSAASMAAMKIKVNYCFQIQGQGAVPAFGKFFYPVCNMVDLTDLKEYDFQGTRNKIAQIESLSVLTGPTRLMVMIEELKVNLLGLLASERVLWQNHGPSAVTKQGNLSLVLLAFAMLCALISSSIKTGRAIYEWRAAP